jgi:leucyl aminopeptidase (aminopeptidase T)
MLQSLTDRELVQLVQRVFPRLDQDRALAVLVDLPDEALADHGEWATRRRLAAEWAEALAQSRDQAGFEDVALIAYRNVRRNNADLPPSAHRIAPGELPEHADGLSGTEIPFEEVFSSFQVMLAPTELSATAPLKLAAREHGFRAATMGGFKAGMVPALRLDYREIDRRCRELKRLLDRAISATIRTWAGGQPRELRVDLRHRRATASGGLFPEPGMAGNLPSGETYIVPYEGEHEDDPSLTSGELPIELEGELMVYRIERNRVVEVIGDGPRAGEERKEMASEPAYANVAELGLGLLAEYGVEPVGTLLLDEKLGLHVAFGRSDHFGGQVGAKDFSAPEKVVHIDRVYIPQVQPGVEIRAVDLELEESVGEPLMRDGHYVPGL